MSTSSREQRRVYVRESANRLSAIGSLVLSPSTAHSIARGFGDVADNSSTVGADLYIPLLLANQRLCSLIGSISFSEEEMSEASEIIKESIVAIQTSLFTFALFGDTDKDLSHIKDITARSEQMSINKASRDQPAPLQTAAQKQSGQSDQSSTKSGSAHLQSSNQWQWSGVHGSPEPRTELKTGLPVSSSELNGGDVTFRKIQDGGDATHLMGSIGLLLGKSWRYCCLRQDVIDVIESVRRSYTEPFGAICERVFKYLQCSVQVLNPSVRVECQISAQVEKRLVDWFSLQSLRPLDGWVSIRQIGSAFFLELVLKDRFIMTDQMLESSDFSERVVIKKSDGLILQAWYSALLPVVRAYQLRYSNGSVLIPVSEVIEAGPDLASSDGIPVFDLNSSASLADLGNIFKHEGIIKDSPDCSSDGSRLMVRWRSKKVFLKATEVIGPNYYLPKRFQFSGRLGKGITGIVMVNPPEDDSMRVDGAGSEVSFVLDVTNWLDADHQDIVMKNRSRVTVPKEVSAGFLCFTLDGVNGIVAVSRDSVLDYGVLTEEIASRNWVDLPLSFHFFARILGRPIEPVQKPTHFIVLSSPQGTIALKVRDCRDFYSKDPISVIPLKNQDVMSGYPFLVGKIGPSSFLPAWLQNGCYLLEPGAISGVFDAENECMSESYVDSNVRTIRHA